MRERLRKKLHSEKGASMLLALLFLLVGLTVGAIVLAAASSAAGHSARVRQEQQDYLAVSSAARLLQEDVKSGRFTAAYTETVTETVYPAVVDEATGEVTTPSQTVTGAPAYAAAASAMTGSKLLTGTVSGLTDIYTSTKPVLGAAVTPEGVELSLELSGGHDMPAVTGTLKIQAAASGGRPAYTLTAVLETEEGGSPLTLVFQPMVQELPTAVVSTNENVTTTVTTYTTTVTWDTPVITKGAAA